MAIPSVENIGLSPGGPLANALRGLNELAQSNIQTKYAPIINQANAASKLAYANLMGPQFLAKLMGNSDIVANSPQLQNPETIKRLFDSGMGSGTGNALLGSINQSNSTPISKVVNTVKNAFGLGVPKTETPPSNALLQDQPNLSQQDKNSMASMQPGQSYTVQGNQSQPANNTQQNPDDFAENAGRFAGTKAQGIETGKIRADDIHELGKQQQNLSESGVILDRLIDITKDPEFQKMRAEVPFFQDKQLNMLSKIGTPAQQQMIGNLLSTSEAFKASTVNSFRGKALEKEFGLADKIKLNENDTINVMLGKLKALKTLKEIAQTKNDMVLDLIENQKMNLGDAVKKTNKLVSTKLIESQVNDLLSPKPSEEDINYMAKKYNITTDEVKKRLKAKGH